MAEKYSFFNAEQNSSGEYDRVYLAEDLAAYFASFVGTGIYASSTDNLKVYPSSGMTIAVKAGKGWIKGYYYENDSDLLLTLDNADGAQARIDSVVLRLDLTNRYMRVFVKKGVVAGNPVAPALTRTADVYELQLATILVKAGLIDITEVEITDSRFNDEVCGIVKGIIEEIDTSNLFNQYDAEFNSWFETVKGQLSGDAAGNLQNQINDIVSGETVPKSGISTYVHSKSGTVHNFEGTGENGKALITADFSAGDTFTVNGEVVSAYCGLEAPDESTIVNGRWVYFAFDGTQLNFKGGGGLSNKKLSSATALPENVLSGKTFYAGDKTIKTGTMPDQSNSIRIITTDASNQTLGAFRIVGNNLHIAPGIGYWGSWNWDISRLQINAANLASAIGLTAAKIVKGNTILGISGAASVSATNYIEVTSSNDKKPFGLQGGGEGWYYYLTFNTGGIIPEMISVQYPGGDFQGVTDNWNYHIIGSAHWFPKSNHDNMQWGTHCVIPIPSANKKYNITIAGHY